MEYTLIRGKFVIRYPKKPNQGPEPDGDTIRFLPDDPQLVRDLPTSGRKVKFGGLRTVAIRLEAIDALETHFNHTHQEPQGGHEARDALLAQLGFEDVVFQKNGFKIESANHNSLPGHVLSNGVDVNGRVIGFVFKDGDIGHNSDVNVKLIDKSVNTKMLAEGLVYPAFYDTLPSTLRVHLATKSEAARTANWGIWSRATASPSRPAEVTSDESLEKLVMWPKLFRRLVDFFSETDDGLGGFIEWLRQDRDDGILLLDTNKEGKLHDIIKISGDRINLKVQPERVVVISAK